MPNIRDAKLSGVFAMRLRISVAIVALLLVTPSVSAQSNSPSETSVDIGGRRIALVLPPDDCALDAKHPRDKKALDTVGQIIGRSGNVLHLLALGCNLRADWRGGKVGYWNEYTQVQTRVQASQTDYSGREQEVVAGICGALKAQGDTMSSDAERKVRGALEAGNEKLKLEQMVFLGALGQDENGCYAGLLVKIQGPSGTARTQLCIYAHVVLQGQIVYLYRYSDQIDAAAAEQMLKERMSAAKAHVEANSGHGRRM